MPFTPLATSPVDAPLMVRAGATFPLARVMLLKTSTAAASGSATVSSPLLTLELSEIWSGPERSVAGPLMVAAGVTLPFKVDAL